MLFLCNQVQYSSPAIDFVEQELETFGAYAAPRPLDVTAEVAPHRFERELRLDEVTFRYPTRAEPALRDVSFAIARR